MAKQQGQKLKLLYLNKFFLENTDENHTATINDIIDYLDSVGIKAERKSLYDDFENLRAFGTDVMSIKQGGTTGYYVADRTFEVSELKLLVDAVQVAKFITDKKSKQLIGKLETLCSRHEAMTLSRQVISQGRIKSMNESIYYNVDKIHNAITKNLSITFRYFEYDANKERVLRHDGKKYHVSPYALNWDDENYYLVAFDEEADMIKHYRVDKMIEISVTEHARKGRKKFEETDISMYSKKVFSMFGGKDTQVCLEFDEKLCGVIIDRFGKDVMMRKSENAGKVYVYCNVVVSPHFFGWLFSLGDMVKIATPQNVTDEFKAYTENVISMYK
ncbi:MAG: WYL domain-containing protein [Ruminococcaceae bacterium]|nr:WYL domain-containing protein [Oscillospiraceae bacterium]